MLSNHGHHIPQATVTLDVFGRWGCAAQTGSNQMEGVHITIKDLLLIVVAGAIWGRQWSGLRIQSLCDNAAVVAIIKSGSNKASIVNALDEVIVLHLSSLQVHFCRQPYSRTKQSSCRDALSWDHRTCFFSLVPQANTYPTLIPPGLQGCYCSTSQTGLSKVGDRCSVLLF